MSRRFERDVRDLFKRALAPRRRVPLVVLLYYWRHVLGALFAVAVLAYVGVRHGWEPLALLVAFAIAATFGRPGGLAYLRDSCWAVFVQHRLRTAFRETGVVTWSGRYPAVLWTRIGPRVVYVQVLCPAGLALVDVAEMADVLAAACFATAVTVEAHPRNAARLTLTVRRGPAAPAPGSDPDPG